MEDLAILKMNLECFRRLREQEADPAQRRRIEDLICSTTNNLKHHQILRSPAQSTVTSGEAQMTVGDPVGFVALCVGLATTTNPTEPGSTPETTRHAGHAVAIHELAERLTAATNYLAATVRLLELAADRPLETEALEKALGQLDRAGDIVISLRQGPCDPEQ